jgi:eukaryotic-like serine/threonine-protein kinase
MSPSNDVLVKLNDATLESRDSVVRFESIGAEVRIGVQFDVGGRRSALPTSGSDRAKAELAAGSMIGGRYELIRVIGRGSMGAVWLAHHHALGEEVAVKLLAPGVDVGGIENPSTSAARFRFEAQVAARLSRKTRHVVRVTDHGHDGALSFLVMERLEGQTLEGALLARGPMTPVEVSALVTQIARGLEVAHAEGVLHRDLKPSNIFLTRGEDGGRLVKILDFGIARRDRSAALDTRFVTAQGVLFGTPGYMSPEQASGSPDLDARTDLWSLAAMAYEALTGELPVTGTDTTDLLANLRAAKTVPLRLRNPELSEACERFFERAFAARVDDRHATSAELALDFERAVASESPTVARRTLRLERGAEARPPTARPRRGVKALVAFAATAFAIGAAWYAFALHAQPAAAAAAAAAGQREGVEGVESATSVAGVADVSTRAGVAVPVVAPLPLDVQRLEFTAATPPLEASPPVKHPLTPNGGLGEFKTYF